MFRNLYIGSMCFILYKRKILLVNLMYFVNLMMVILNVKKSRKKMIGIFIIINCMRLFKRYFKIDKKVIKSIEI